MKRWEESGWTQEDLDKLELSFLTNILELQETEGVDATIAYARYLSMVGVNPDNYPIFLKILALRNHWVADALLGNAEPETFFIKVQPNYYILKECFRALTQAKRGGLYPKALQVYLGLLKVTYQSPLEGYRVYPLNPEDVNNLGKHLDEAQDQKYDLNSSILSILDTIASLVDPGRPSEDQELMSVATQANNIRGKFLDMNKSLDEAIPDLLLKTEDYTQLETPPSKQ
ncbi:MAG: hypothetical protein K9L68_03865 [Spirochaetales bacterium]|nr:hypothetical protein [Spirochaetales bacterium]MCF7937716.1 hypothetical protein [Spirochaetales bacterium]